MVGQMSMIVHVRWVGGLVNVHVDKLFKKWLCWRKYYFGENVEQDLIVVSK